MSKEKAKQVINKASHAVDDAVENAAEKHNFPKWVVWTALAVAIVLTGLFLNFAGVI